MKLHLNNQTGYENFKLIAINKWIIQECGISQAGKRKVVAIRVDHVNYSGENVSYPINLDTKMNFDVGLIKNLTVDPFSTPRTYYKAYKLQQFMSSDLYRIHQSIREDFEPGYPFPEQEPKPEMKPRMVDISEYLSRMEVEVDARLFLRESLLIARCNTENHKKLATWFKAANRGHDYSLRCNLLFYEIEFSPEHETREWSIEDVLSGSPVKLGSIGCLLTKNCQATLKSGKPECVIELVTVASEFTGEDPFGTELVPGFPKTVLNLDLNAFNLSQKLKTEVKVGKQKVVNLGRNPENNKLTMMLVNVREVGGSDEK